MPRSSNVLDLAREFSGALKLERLVLQKDFYRETEWRDESNFNTRCRVRNRDDLVQKGVNTSIAISSTRQLPRFRTSVFSSQILPH